MISVAGIRGVVGDSLDPSIVARFAAALARSLPGAGPVVIGRDARVSGPMVRLAGGRRRERRRTRCRGHRPRHNAHHAARRRAPAGRGRHHPHREPQSRPLERPQVPERARGVPGPARRQRRSRTVRQQSRSVGELGQAWRVREERNALEWHLERVLALKHLDVAAIRARALHVVVDGCASVGGVALPALLERLGAKVTKLDCEPNGKFTRELEPLPEHLSQLGKVVREVQGRPRHRQRSGRRSRGVRRRRRACRSARSTRWRSARAWRSRHRRVRW
jgi:phosphomannomutase